MVFYRLTLTFLSVLAEIGIARLQDLTKTRGTEEHTATRHDTHTHTPHTHAHTLTYLLSPIPHTL